MITDSGNALQLIATNGSVLRLDAASTAHTVTLGATGNLTLGANATLTVATAMDVGTGGLALSPGSIFTDASGVTINGGAVGVLGGGAGIFNADLSGTGTIIASGGTLHLTGAVASGPTFLIFGGVLSIENTATAAAPISITTSDQTLAIGSSGNLTINGGVQSVANGTITISAGGQLTDSAGFAFDSFATLIGAGRMTGPIGGGDGTGIVEASGGTLELVSALPAAANTAFKIANSAASALLLDGVAGTGNTFSFLGANGALALGNDSGFNDTVSGLNVAAGIVKTNFVDIKGHTVTIGTVTGQGTTSGTITLSDGAVLNLTNLNSSSWVADAVDDGAGGTDVFVREAVCFCRGTLILTERGEVPVEDLAVGERAITQSGQAKPIVWIGMGRETVTRANKLARPVIVCRGALADGVPARDLFLTHGHALYLDGLLIPVENLVNHRSILWDERAETVVFYHVELADHDVLLANGAPAESYYAARNRALFDTTRPGSVPANAAPEFAPVLSGGAAVELVWRALLERAGGRIEAGATGDPDLHLVVDGARLDPAAVDGLSYGFALASPPAGGLRLRSRTGVPSLLGITAHDHRRLGVAISRVVFAQPGIATTLEYDAPLFAAGGCHPPEQGYCWTDGEFELPARLFAHFRGALTVTVHTMRPGGMRYPLSSAVADAA